MAEAKEAPESLQTEVDDMADSSEAFARIAESMVPGQEAATESTETEAEETTDLSHSEKEPDQAPEEPAEPTAEDDAETDDDELPPKVKETINKRIGKLVAARKAAEEKAAAREAELAELRATLEKPEKPEPERPEEPAQPQSVPGLHKLEVEIDKVAKTHNASIEYLNRLKRDPDRVVRELQKANADIQDEEEARAFLEGVRDNTGREWNKLTSRHESQRVHLENQMATEREQTFAQVKVIYPWVEAVRSGKDKTGPEAKIVGRILKEAPGLDKSPRGWQVLARLVRAELAEQADVAAKAKPAAPPVKPPKLPTTAKPSAPINGKPKTDTNALVQKVIETGSDEDAERAIDAITARMF